MKTIIHKADTRGYFNHGWLKTHHTFSFAGYYDPKRTHFGLLRVLNDDTIDPGMGFGTHPHDNMEIVTIPLEGTLEHQDSTGHKEVLKTEEVQIMSAGSGLTHSEYNHSKAEPVTLLQIWVFPKEKDITPRYDQKIFDKKDRENKLNTMVSPEKNGHSLWIKQDAYFSRLKLDSVKYFEYKINKNSNGLYVFLIDGKINIDGQTLDTRDGIGIEDTNAVSLKAEKDSEILFIEIPMR
jgi:redox-sensitive bicupin YhaK (pirin superfamily)